MSIATTCREDMSIKSQFIDISVRSKDHDKGIAYKSAALVGLMPSNYAENSVSLQDLQIASP
jgi:hypothetical protein